jgi:hypothetical protein
MIAKVAEAATYAAAHEWHAELGRRFGIDVLQPIHELGIRLLSNSRREN